jgi:ribokinase
MPSRVVVIGSSNTDLIVRAPRIPAPGETVLGGEFITAAGGKGANQAVAAARAGAQVSFVAKIGRDTSGSISLAGFRREGIDVTHVTKDAKRPSGVALIVVDDQGENAIAVASGANDRLSPADIRRASRTIARANIALLQLESPVATVAAGVRLAADAKVRVILNPAPASAVPDALFRRVSILTPNESEATLLTGIRVSDVDSARRAAEQLRRRGAATVIVTLGARGALVVSEEGSELIRGFRVKAVDTTAAGDVFNGALAASLARGDGLRSAVRFANAAAAISVTRVGAQPSIPTRREIERLLRKHTRR